MQPRAEKSRTTHPIRQRYVQRQSSTPSLHDKGATPVPDPQSPAHRKYAIARSVSAKPQKTFAQSKRSSHSLQTLAAIHLAAPPISRTKPSLLPEGRRVRQSRARQLQFSAPPQAQAPSAKTRQSDTETRREPPIPSLPSPAITDRRVASRHPKRMREPCAPGPIGAPAAIPSRNPRRSAQAHRGRAFQRQMPLAQAAEFVS